MVSAIRCAAAMDDENDEAELPFIVEEGEVFNQIITSCLETIPSALEERLNRSEMTSRKPLPPSASPRWRKVQPLVKSFLASLLRLVAKMTDAQLLSQMIRGLQSLVSYFACFPKLGKEFVRQLLHQWSNGEETTRIVAFLSLRQLAIEAPNPYLDKVLKETYKTFVQVSKNTSIHTWTQLKFLSSCLVELGGLHLVTTYQHGFVAIRELALLLRNALHQKTKESVKSIYSWPFVHRLKLWSDMIATYGKESPGGGEALMYLVYPLAQVALGSLRLRPSSKYVPLRFQILRLLLDLSSKTATFIPLASFVFEVRHSF